MRHPRHRDRVAGRRRRNGSVCGRFAADVVAAANEFITR
jgi:hypothetical protein